MTILLETMHMLTFEGVPAAQYLRVSTDHQRYSLDRQRDCIERYANEHGFKVIKTYVDQAKSGLCLRNRPGLKQLLSDVTGRRVQFRAIIVYDVSRWGRFQDIDEAGHYEFICRDSGAPVRYCAELFTGDDTATNFIMKVLKRTMAAEYSRELGNRCVAGKQRLARLGFRVGGAAPYGYRRVLVSPDRSVKQQLKPGERKGIATDRVLLIPGPDQEVGCVRKIYGLFIERGMSFCAIARYLNERAIPYIGSRPWTHHGVRAIIKSVTYNGTLVYGRTSKRLQTPEVKIPTDQWIVVPRAFESIVEDGTFVAAQRELVCRTNHKTNDQLLDELRSILNSHGKLTAELIRKTKGATPPNSYRKRFGSLGRAYSLIGYRMSIWQNIETRERIRTACSRLIEDLQRFFPDSLSIEGKRNSFRRWLQLRNGTRILVQGCMSFKTPLGNERWRIRGDSRHRPCFILLLLMSAEDGSVERLYLLPPFTLPRTLDVSHESRLFKMGRLISQLNTLPAIVDEMRRGD